MTVARAIVQMRMRMQISQQELAHRIASAMSAVTKYESGRMPNSAALWRLTLFAERNGHSDLAVVFRRQFRRRMSMPDPFDGYDATEPLDGLETLLAASLLEMMRGNHPNLSELVARLDAAALLIGDTMPTPVRKRWMETRAKWRS